MKDPGKDAGKDAGRDAGKGGGFEAELERAKRASTAQLLLRCARMLNERGVARAAARAGLPLRPSHTSLLPHIDLEGTRQSELAKRLGISRQAVHQLVGELEEFGLLERTPDPTDRRATRVAFTAAGRQSLLDGLRLLQELEGEMQEVIGPEPMRRLHETLSTLDGWFSSPAGDADGATAPADDG